MLGGVSSPDITHKKLQDIDLEINLALNQLAGIGCFQRRYGIICYRLLAKLFCFLIDFKERNVQLTFTWNFDNSQIKFVDVSTGLEEEQSRVTN